MGGAPVVALRDIVLLSDQGGTPILQRHKDWRRRVVASISALRASDTYGAMPIEPDRQIDRLKVGLSIDQIERHTYAVGFQIAVALM